MMHWMLYAAAVGLLAAVAAWGAEQALRRVGRPSRGVWAGALGISLLLPVAVAVQPAPVVEVTSAGAVAAVALPDGAQAPTMPAAPRAAPGGSAWLLRAWGGLSAAVAASLIALHLLLVRRRRRWRRMEVDGERVCISRETGPAVVGWWRPEIVLPEWMLEWGAERRGVVLAHEREHLRARDPLLFLCALLPVVALPWSPALWWQLHRLRLAIEVDCDARVLRGHPGARRYALLLLEVGTRAHPALATPFSSSRSLLERRIRMLDRSPRPRAGVLAACVLLVLAAPAALAALPAPQKSARLVVTEVPEGTLHAPPESMEVAVEVPSEAAGEGATPEGARAAAPGATTPPRERAGLESRAGSARAPEDLRPAPADTPRVPGAEPADTMRPVFTPFEVRPEPVDRAAVQRAIMDAYPVRLREAGVGGQTTVWVYVDAEGVVRRTVTQASSGNEELDAAARRALSTARFVPARNQGRPVAVWVAFPVTFSSRTWAPPEGNPGRGDAPPDASRR